MMHGITETKDEWEGFYTDMAKSLFDEGIGTFRFDFRGHGESGGSQMDVSLSGDVRDIKASLNEVREYWDGDVNFIATSFGAGPAIIASGDLKWINEHVGELTQKQLMFIYKRLEREAW